MAPRKAAEKAPEEAPAPAVTYRLRARFYPELVAYVNEGETSVTFGADEPHIFETEDEDLAQALLEQHEDIVED